MKFTAIDFETAQGKRWSVCQVGVIEVENGRIINKFSSLIKPPFNEYSPWNIAVHGIRAVDTINAPLFPDVWIDLKPFIENKLVVAHNAAFDVSCIKQTLDFYNLDLPDFDVDCTYKRTKLSLDKACKGYNIDLNNHHDALCDALACAKIYFKLLNNEDFDILKIPVSNKRNVFRAHENIKAKSLKYDLKNADNNNFFYNKKIVFTGILKSISRSEAADLVKKLGAYISTSICKSTDYVILGLRPGPAKLSKIENYNSLGSDIKIITEEEFFEIIKKI